MNMFTALMVAASVAMATPSCASRRRGECPCFPWMGKKESLICKDPSLTSIPTCVPYDVHSIAIQSPNIPLVAETLINYPLLPQLNIQYIKKPKIAKDMFKHVRYLNYLQILKTGLDYVDPEWFMYAPHLRTVSLHHNKLKDLPANTFHYLPVLETVHLDNNKLTSLSPEVFKRTNLKTLYLEKNPWHCDCHMSRFMQWTRDNGVKIADKPYCAGPKGLETLPLEELPKKHACKRRQHYPY